MGVRWTTVRARKNQGLIAPGQENFALEQVKMYVWWSGGQLKLASVVLLVIVYTESKSILKLLL